MPGTGNQPQSLESPPMRSTGWEPGASASSSLTNTGLTFSGLVPAYFSTAVYSSDRPTKPGATGRLMGVAVTVT